MGTKLRPKGSITITSGTVAASGTYTSDPIDINELIEGYLSLQWVLTGDGTAKIEALSSNDDSVYLDVNADIAAAQTKTTGPSADGKNMASFDVVPSTFLKIKVTETGGASSVTLSMKLVGR